MRVGILCHSSLGGSGRIATELAVGLSRRGHRLHLFSRTVPFNRAPGLHNVVLHHLASEPAESAPAAGLPLDWPEGDTRALLGQITRVIAGEGLDLLHFHYAVPFARIAGELKRSLTSPPLLVGTLHGTDVSLHGRDPLAGPPLARALASLDALTTVSRSHAALAGEVFGLSELPRVIPNFVDLSRFRPRSQGCWPLRSGGNGDRRKARIIHISNFRAVKNPAGLARIFAGLRERLAAELWLVGAGPELGRLQSHFRRLGLEREVVYWGARRRVAPLLARADLLLMPSLAESFCLAALEAQACGVPVLASRVGGLPEVVDHGRTGLLFPPAEPEAAVELAVQLLSQPARHRAMREAAIRQARRFEPGRVIAAYEHLYRSLLNRRQHPRPWSSRDNWPGTAAPLPPPQPSWEPAVI